MKDNYSTNSRGSPESEMVSRLITNKGKYLANQERREYLAQKLKGGTLNSAELNEYKMLLQEQIALSK